MARFQYRFDPDYTVEGRHYAHPLISWGAVIAGALIAVAIGVMLTLLGVAIGATSFNPYEVDSGTDEAISIGGGLYMAFAQLVALQIGAYIAARGARFPDHHGGLLHGISVWGLAVMIVLVGAALGASVGSAGLLAGPGAGAQIAETIQEVGQVAGPGTADPEELAAAERAADVTATIAWWGFACFALGLAGAVAGGWLGAHHPAWDKRPRIDDRVSYQRTADIH